MSHHPRLLIKPSPSRTRLLLMDGPDELLRAALPPMPAAHLRAVSTLLEGIALWTQRRLSVVLCADAEVASCVPDLCDGLGYGRETLHYAVEVFEPRNRRRGLGSFRDLRQLVLVGVR
jgi:hypothetical protein